MNYHSNRGLTKAVYIIIIMIVAVSAGVFVMHHNTKASEPSSEGDPGNFTPNLAAPNPADNSVTITGTGQNGFSANCSINGQMAGNLLPNAMNDVAYFIDNGSEVGLPSSIWTVASSGSPIGNCFFGGQFAPTHYTFTTTVDTSSLTNGAHTFQACNINSTSVVVVGPPPCGSGSNPQRTFAVSPFPFNVAHHYTIGGTISGLSGTVVLKDNGGDNLSTSSNGGFTFATPIASGSGYSASIVSQPSGQTCTLSNPSGAVGSSNVTNIGVNCSNNASTIAVGTNLPNNGNSLYGTLNNSTWNFKHTNITDPCATGNCTDVTSGNYTASNTSGSSNQLIFYPDTYHYYLDGTYHSNSSGAAPIGYSRNITKNPVVLNPFGFYLSKFINVANADDCGYSGSCTIYAFTNGGSFTYSSTYTAETCAIKLNVTLNGTSTPKYGATYTVNSGGNSYSGTFNSSPTQVTSSAPTDAATPATYTVTIPETYIDSSGVIYDVNNITGYSVYDSATNATTNYSTTQNTYNSSNNSMTAGFSCNYDATNITPETTTINVNVQPRAGIQVK